MQFDFGENWVEFSENALTWDRAMSAVNDFSALFRGIAIESKTFLDIGCGQGLSLLSAEALGARVVGCDINSKCIAMVRRNRKYFNAMDKNKVTLVTGSILEDDVVQKLRQSVAGSVGYDIVHAWGVLHHTGDMRRALINSISLVKPGGHLVVAIYNRHWSNPAWKCIKALYCVSPVVIQKSIVCFFYFLLIFAKMLVTGENPLEKQRGMDFYHDVVDWVGGYPYEYAGKNEIDQIGRDHGLELLRFIPAKVPTGCNEYIFQKRP
jgi:2-polyprenyl-3-methyl-5-hydroxy-6-metoxy-1,4-benzoquinol methylase